MDWLPLTQFSYNVKQQASTKKSSFEVTCSYTPKIDVKSYILKAPAADGLANEIARTLEETTNNLEKAQDCMKIQVDKRHSEAPAYAIRELIWLSMNNLHLLCTSKKLSECWLALYKITKTVDSNAIELLLLQSM